MEVEELIAFAKEQHQRLQDHYHAKGDARFKYAHFAKLIEEVGELSEAILHQDSLQRGDKLRAGKPEVPPEIADVIITALVLSQELGVDVKAALLEKMEKIRSRSYA